MYLLEHIRRFKASIRNFRGHPQAPDSHTRPLPGAAGECTPWTEPQARAPRQATRSPHGAALAPPKRLGPNREPGRYVIALGADREDRDPDVGEGDGSPIDLVAPCGQVIIEEQMAKIL